MIDVSAIPSAIASLKTATEILKALYGAKLSADVQQKVAELQQLIFDARQSAFDAQEELALVKANASQLKNQLVAFEQWGEESQRYQLLQPDELRSVVYALKESKAGGEPAHYLCTNCYQQRRKTILNLCKTQDGWSAFSCPACKAQVLAGGRGPVPAVYVSG